MTEPYTEFAKIALPGIIGVAGGYFLKRWDVHHQQEKYVSDTWTAQKRTHWSPLLRATGDLEARFTFLRDIYHQKPSMPFSPASLSADFRELYMLSRAEIPNLQDVNPNAARQNSDAVQRARTRVCHELTFAESSVFITAAYLAHAEHVWRGLDEDLLEIASAHRAHLVGLLSGVRQALQGKSGAGIFIEQQEYIGQTLLLPSGGVVANLDFRKRLFDLPGWETFSNLLRFFAEFGPKVNYEITGTIQALGPLKHAVTLLRDASTKAKYETLLVE